MHVRFSFKNFLSWLTYSVDVRVYPSLRILTFKLCVGFMALLVLISSLILGTAIALAVRDRIVEIAGIYDQHFPSATLVDGRLVVEDETPVNYKGKDYQVVMDVSGKTYTRDSDFPIALFFLQDRVIIDTAESDSKEYNYSLFARTDMKIDAQSIDSSKTAVAFIAFLSWSLLLFIDWSMRTALMTMLGSFVVGIISAFFHILLPRNEQLKIALTASAPVTVIMIIEHLLLLREKAGFGITQLPNSLYGLNLAVFTLFLVFGSRGYLLPFLPKNPDQA